ncbi:hypothetical protein DIJ60_21180, partial [Burkholderia pseudomallei]
MSKCDRRARRGRFCRAERIRRRIRRRIRPRAAGGGGRARVGAGAGCRGGRARGLLPHAARRTSGR